MSLLRRVSLLFLVSILVAACSDEGDPPSPTDPGGGGGEGVSFVADVQPIFDSRCTGCHGEGGNGGLDLRGPQSHGNLVDVTSRTYGTKRVVPGDPDASVLIDKISGGGRFGSRMPPTGPGLTDAQVAVIRNWVSGGAQAE